MSGCESMKKKNYASPEIQKQTRRARFLEYTRHDGLLRLLRIEARRDRI